MAMNDEHVTALNGALHAMLLEKHPNLFLETQHDNAIVPIPANFQQRAIGVRFDTRDATADAMAHYVDCLRECISEQLLDQDPKKHALMRGYRTQDVNDNEPEQCVWIVEVFCAVH
jgi:hypothetical protein